MGVSFAAKRAEPAIPLWVLFLAVQFLDVLWAPFVLVGIDKARIVPGFAVARPSRRQTSMVIGLAVFSHWVLDVIVHRPDLPLYDNSAKVGLGLWNAPALAFGLEATLLLGGMWLCFRGQLARVPGTLVFGVLMCAVQAYVFFGPPPTSDRAFAWTALIAYAAFATVIWWLHERRAVI
jgi:hypothetical protein